MAEPEDQEPKTAAIASEQGKVAKQCVLLVVEPDSLLRWSLLTYFGPRFEVRAVRTAEAGGAVLEDEGASAVVVSDAVAPLDVVKLERRALSLNPDVRIIRVVTSLRSAPADALATATLEKPFELSALAELLPT